MTGSQELRDRLWNGEQIAVMREDDRHVAMTAQGRSDRRDCELDINSLLHRRCCRVVRGVAKGARPGRHDARSFGPPRGRLPSIRGVTEPIALG